MSINQLTEAIQHYKNGAMDRARDRIENFKFPTELTPKELELCIESLYFIILKPAPEHSKDRDDQCRVHWKCGTLFEQLLQDEQGVQRAWQKEDLELEKQEGISYREFLEIYIDPSELPDSLPENDEEILAYLQNFYGYAPPPPDAWAELNADAVLQPFFEKYELAISVNPYCFYPIAWKVLQYGQSAVQKAFINWFKRLEQTERVESQFDKNIAQAIAWDRFLATANQAPIEASDIKQWMKWLDHKSILLQSIAAKCLGACYQVFYIEERSDQWLPMPLPEMLTHIAQKHKDGQLVAGGFINGLSLDECDGMHVLNRHPELKKINFDARSWVLDICTHTANDGDPYVPTAQAFWFYVHEFFDYDAEAVHTLIDHQKYFLAEMCATESIYADQKAWNIMKPVLERWIKEVPLEKERMKKIVLNCEHKYKN